MPRIKLNNAMNEDKIKRIAVNVVKETAHVANITKHSKDIVAMASVFTEGQYHFAFLSFDLTNEPLHIHVSIEGRSAKFWVKDDKYGKKDIPETEWNHDCKLAENKRMKEHELNTAMRIIEERREEIVQKWEAELNRKNKNNG